MLSHVPLKLIIANHDIGRLRRLDVHAGLKEASYLVVESFGDPFASLEEARLFQSPLQQAHIVGDGDKLRLRKRCKSANQPRFLIVLLLVLFALFIAEAAYLVEGDPALLIFHRREEIALNDLLSREEEQAVAPLLADVAPVGLAVHVPDEGTLHVELHIVLVRVLILKQLRSEDVAREDQIV